MLGKIFKRNKPQDPGNQYDKAAELEWDKKKSHGGISGIVRFGLLYPHISGLIAAQWHI